jgi:hypothetical protein
MADRAPGAGSDLSHNVVPMRGGRPGIPDRERVQRTRERRLRIAVLAFAHRAAPEIIAHGVNGFMCRDEHEMAELVEQAAGIEPMRCRETAAERFVPDRVAAGCEAVYRKTLARAVDRRRTGAPAA